MSQAPDYAELHCLSSFSFQRGASHPHELVDRAADLGYQALAITDECSMAGVVRAHEQARERGLHLIIGSEFTLDDGNKLVLLATDRAAYARLCGLITLARGRTDKGTYHLAMTDLLTQPLAGCLLIWLGDDAGARALMPVFAERLWLGVALFATADRDQHLADMQRRGRALGLPLVACGDVHMHARGRRALQDTLTAIRLGRPLTELGYALFPNGERHLRDRASLAAIYPRPLLDESVTIAHRCTFALDTLRYEYPHELVPDGQTPDAWLRQLTEDGARHRYPDGVPASVCERIEHELTLIADKRFADFFLTVHEVVQWARAQNILCQGRGSAANSVVCYCLGITAVNPVEQQMLFERFISRARDEPPDIDVDFEHQRREEVIQHIYDKYGRDRAALAATVIRYRPRSAIRDVGKALGLSLDQVDALARTLHWWDSTTDLAERVAEAGLSPDSPVIRQLLVLVRELVGFPRHLSQHVGGFVISQRPVHELVPIENATMAERTVIQWDKDDLETLGLLKVDVLALGMLTAIRKCFDLIAGYHGRQLTLASIGRDDAETFAMIQRADTVGVFQIESRAQMTMLPRLKPARFYDLVIEVAIVRPGPIEGGMVNPYLERRAMDPADIDYVHDDLKPVLERTLGVPIFQEQVMQIAIVAGGFSPDEADRVRRSMAAWRRRGGLEGFEQQLKAGMAQRGYPAEFADRIFKQILGFGEYGFPESHAASFALLAYASAWLKCHYPAAFTAALLNSLPMGFYGPAQLIADVRRHGVTVYPVDVLHSDVASTLQPDDNGAAAIRLGLDRIKGLDADAAERIAAWRRHAGSSRQPITLQDMVHHARLRRRDVEALAAAGALRSLSGHRHHAFWDAAGVEAATPLLGQPRFAEGQPLLAAPTETQDTLADYAHLDFTLGRHPVALIRTRLDARGVTPAAGLTDRRNGEAVIVAGLVTARQRPATASGTVFLTVEDETGSTNLIVWPTRVDGDCRILLTAQLVQVQGRLQSQSGVIQVIAESARDISSQLAGLQAESRDFH